MVTGLPLLGSTLHQLHSNNSGVKRLSVQEGWLVLAEACKQAYS